jgi:hypothetical protein
MTTQPDLFLSSPAPAQRHSRTSLAAARAIEPSMNTDKLRVLMALREAGSRGMTDDELQVVLDLSGDTERPRRISLCEVGLVWASQEWRKTRSGRDAVVWKAGNKL